MLQVKNVSFAADGKQIIRNISFTLDDGKFLIITGPNGGGKSTLARLITVSYTHLDVYKRQVSQW